MSIPSIPGFSRPPAGESLADEWPRPPGGYPDALWPTEVLRRITPQPLEWVTLVEHFYSPDEHGGNGSMLIRSEHVDEAFARDAWIGRDLGDVWAEDGGGFHDGLTDRDRGIDVEFLCRVRSHHELRVPSVEIAHPFLWCWDAFERNGDWYYLNRAGRDCPLVRSQVSSDSWRVGFRALELRHYLSARDRVCLVQFDHVPKMDAEPFDRFDAEHRSTWASASWHCIGDEHHVGGNDVFSRLLGKYVIGPLKGAATPRWEERDEELDYPEFQYDVDPSSGSPLKHTCDPHALGTYFDEDNSRTHFLTPVYFRREVLGRYVAEPTRYTVTSTRLSCLDLWSLDISSNTAGLVEVYLGDLGESLPPDEWLHWLGHNVAPSGQMAEDRFRRDFLNQPTASNDPASRLRRARQAAADVTEARFEAPLWRPLSEPERTEFERLHGPTTEEQRSLNAPVLAITKAIVDGIDVALLRKLLDEKDKTIPSLMLLKRFEERCGGDGSSAAILRSLQRLRSAGGVAHMSGSDREDVLDRIGITNMPPAEAFDHICDRVATALEDLSVLVTRYQDTQAD